MWFAYWLCGSYFSLLAVSYTHLDVYKRQPLECERLQGFPNHWTDIPGASDSARYKALGNSVATVSYTHLDVYKRQVCESGTAPTKDHQLEKLGAS